MDADTPLSTSSHIATHLSSFSLSYSLHVFIDDVYFYFLLSPSPTPQAANGFMMIISCLQARVIFISDAVQDVLNESPDSWIGACFYDLLHPKDIQKVKEQLACFDLEEGKDFCPHTTSKRQLGISFRP